VNGNYNAFKEGLSSIKEDVILIGNSIGKDKVFPFKVEQYLPMSSQVINDWNNQRVETIISPFIRTVMGKINPLVLMAAGPLSEILIDCAYKLTKGRFIDVGSSLDEFIFKRQTRGYMIPGSPYNTRVCIF
jgi:hypothetical protein